MLAGFYSELLRVLRVGLVVSGGAGLEGPLQLTRRASTC